MWKNLIRRTLLEWVKPQTRERGKRPCPTKTFIPCIQVESQKSLLFGPSSQHHNDEEKEKQKRKHTCNEHSSSHFKLNADTFLETFGWVGTAFILGLHLRNFCWKSQYPSKTHNGHASGAVHPNNQICFCDLISPFIISPVVFNMHSSRQRLKNNYLKPPEQAPEQETLKECTTNNCEKEEISEDITKVCEDLVSVTVEYFGEIENFVGVSEKNQRKAFIHFRKGAKYGCAKANFNLGICYETGYGTDINFSKAAEHYKLASKAGHSLATYNLGVYYLEGKGGLLLDKAVGLELIAKAAETGVCQAQTHMGIHFLEQQDWPKGLSYLKDASNEDPEATYYLGMCYENGWGVSRNLDKSRRFYQEAASAGNEDALRVLEHLKLKDKLGHEDKCSQRNIGMHAYSSVPELYSQNDEKSLMSDKQKDISLYLDIVLPDAWRKPSKVNFWLGDSEESTIFRSESIEKQVILPVVDVAVAV